MKSARGSWGARVPWSSPAGPCGSLESTAGPSLSKSTGRPQDGKGRCLRGPESFPLGLPSLDFLNAHSEPSRPLAVHAGTGGPLYLLLLSGRFPICPFPSV